MIKKEYIQPSIEALEALHAVMSTISDIQNQGEAGGNVTPNGFDVDFEEDFNANFNAEHYGY